MGRTGICPTCSTIILAGMKRRKATREDGAVVIAPQMMKEAV